jgi:hypothetical protein
MSATLHMIGVARSEILTDAFGQPFLLIIGEGDSVYVEVTPELQAGLRAIVKDWDEEEISSHHLDDGSYVP